MWKLVSDNNSFNFLFSTAMGFVDCKRLYFCTLKYARTVKQKVGGTQTKSLTARIYTGAVQV